MASPNRFEISEQTHSANFAMYNFHSHSWYEIFYLQSGQCTFYIQDRTYLMNEGDIAVIPPDIPHKTAYLAEVNKRLCIEFSANYIQPVISMFGNETLDSRLFTVLHNSTENTAFLDSLILNIINEHKQRDYISPAFLNVYFQEFILRLSAEFDNFRKRTLKEKAELIKNGGEKAINAILPILDDLERALQNMQKAEDVKAIYEGVELIYQKFLKNLHQEGLEKMEPVGEAFDTDFHEAVALVPAPSEEQKGKILDCVQTGYKLNEKVIRHAKVVVAQ